MKTILAFILFLMGLLSSAGSHSFAQTPVAATPTPIKVDLHKDWFQTAYDDVRDITVIKTGDNYGPGAGLAGFNGDVFKVSMGAKVPGKTFDPKTPIVVTVAFSRAAGIKEKTNDGLMGSSGDIWQPFHGNQVFTLDQCKDVLFVIPGGEHLEFKDTAISYKQTHSTGFLGEQYVWETLTVTADLNLLLKLQDGAKVALCDTSTSFVNDTIAQARSLLASLNDLAPAVATK